ncbi:MAG: hypothetical protein BAA01_15725 [Bacillus thermozeamaize]|uniref:Uncharacterized protein n=1 Tax=Bacillus thermozeamaize TaxID=230954 RepID=A0A1Y3PVY7_9BACI|nr:MAG: hypothetical protein BAA01_15725 [Bacillus thermozeamaize]
MPFIRTIFIYAVMFATLMMTVGGGVGAFMAMADLVSPPAYYQSFQDYKQMRQHEAESKDTTGKPAQLSEEELKKEYEEMIAAEQARIRQSAINSLIKSLGWILIPFPVFLYMQRLQRARE